MANSPAMNIDEAKALKAALAQDIEKLLTNFTATTGTTVESVYVDRPTVMIGWPPSYSVTVEVRL